MDYIAQNGGRILTFLTAVAALAATMETQLNIPTHVMAWITFGSGVCALGHTIFFPGQTAEQRKNGSQ